MQPGELAARARTVAQLGDIVQAMRTLASARRRQAQERFSGLQRYAAATRAALGEALALLPVPPSAEPSSRRSTARRVVVLFSEHGFVGPLNDRLLEAALPLRKGGETELVAVGSRGRRLCRERDVHASDGGAMPTAVAGVQATAQRLIEDLFGAVAEGRVGEMHVVFAEHRPPVAWDPRVLRLFPPEIVPPERSEEKLAPIHTLEPRVLVAKAIEEYAFAQVGWAVGEAFASEQAARFVAMDAAHHHVEDKLSELRALERQVRQEAITSEILEIASGAESAEGVS
jgi:F-type H+-transporting ATPase subunit gamma